MLRRRGWWRAFGALAGTAAIAAGALYLVDRGGGPNNTRVTTSPATSTPDGSANSAGCSNPTASGWGPLQQRLDGTITGCLPIDVRPAGAYTVSLSTIITGSGLATATGRPTATIALEPASGPPGTRITVTGHYAGPLPGGQGSHAYACWDGCPDGLMEDGVEVTWGPDGTFSTTVLVPETAWLENGVAHPLASGIYQVGIECLGADVKGCATMPAQAAAPFHLVAPPPDRCVAHRPCGELHLSPDHGVPGDTVGISGWAPLAQIIGQPFGYQTDISAGAGPGVGVVGLPKGGADRATVAQAPLRIDPPPPWSNVDASHQLWSQSAGAPVLVADPADPRRFAYCAPGSIRLSGDGGATFSDVPTRGMAAALAGTTFQLSAPGPSACSDLALDPRRPGTFYAALTVNPNGEAPPFEMIGMVTTDAGSHWSLVPTPTGTSPGLFSDFRADPGGVDAVFNPARPDSGGGPLSPGGASTVVVERSTDGGSSWASTRLACPASGPCATFGGHWLGNCAMNGSQQTLAYSTDGGATWAGPVWPATVNACGFPQLAALADGSLLLIDPASGFLVRRSSDGGRIWSYLGTPDLPGTTPGQVDPTGGIALLTDGDLLSVGTGGPWYLLARGAVSWCQLSMPPGSGQAVIDGTSVAIGDRLWWLQWPEPGVGSSETLMSSPLSSLKCKG